MESDAPREALRHADSRLPLPRRHYLFTLTDGGGTIPPELGVARRLADGGHRVTVLGPAGAHGPSAGIEHLAWDRPAAPVDDWSRRTPRALARGMADQLIAGPAHDQLQQVLAVIDACEPDLVVTSFTAFGAMIAADSRDVPYDVLIPNLYPMPAPGLPPFGTGLAPMRGLHGRLRDAAVNLAARRLLDRYALGRLNALRLSLDLAPIGTVFDQVQRARRQHVLSARAFDFPASLPGTASRVGPILDDPPWAALPWQPPAASDPLVLVALSSTFQDHAACLRRIVAALGALPVRGLVTTGPAIAPESLDPPANVEVAAAAPHGQVLPRASAVVTHGGHGTVMKALVHGVPLVVIPHGRDQADNAVRVTARGAGIRVARTASVSKLARAVDAVVTDPAYGRAARQLGAAIQREADESDLIPLLEELPEG